jgi:hypothetical protein
MEVSAEGECKILRMRHKRNTVLTSHLMPDLLRRPCTTGAIDFEFWEHGTPPGDFYASHAALVSWGGTSSLHR